MIGDWNAKVGSQEIYGLIGKFGLLVQNKAGQRLTEFCQENLQGHSKHLLPTTLEKTLHMDITRWSIKIRLIIFLAAKDEEALYSQQKQDLGADCGSDHDLLIAEFRLKLKKAGESTRPFRFDLNQIPYNHTMKVTNRFKGLDLIDRVPDALWMEVHDCTGSKGQDHPQEKERQKSIMVV